MCSRDRTRTYNLPVNSRTLCRLSYAGPYDAARTAAGPEPGYREHRVAATRLAHPRGSADPPAARTALSQPLAGHDTEGQRYAA